MKKRNIGYGQNVDAYRPPTLNTISVGFFFSCLRLCKAEMFFLCFLLQHFIVRFLFLWSVLTFNCSKIFFRVWCASTFRRSTAFFANENPKVLCEDLEQKRVRELLVRKRIFQKKIIRCRGRQNASSLCRDPLVAALLRRRQWQY